MQARRMVVAALIVLIAGAMLVAASGLIAADRAMPKAFGTPGPRVGDAVLYNFTFVNATGPWGTQDEPFWMGLGGWTWIEPSVVRDAQGRQWRAPTIDQGLLHFGAEPDRWALNIFPIVQEQVTLAGNETVAVERGKQEDMIWFQFPALFPEIPPRPATELLEDEHHVDYTLDSLAGCLMRHHLQSRMIATERPVVIFRGCSDLGLAIPGTPFRAGAIEELPIGQALRFDGPDATVWFARDLAYPVRLELPADDGRWIVTLENATRGAGPFVADAVAIDPKEASALRYAARLPWGPDDADILHPFPLSAAVERARSDPAYAEFRDWTAAHPDWYLVRAHYEETHAQGNIDRTWTGLAVEGSGSFRLQVTQEVRPAGGDALRFIVPSPPAITSYSYGTQPSMQWAMPWPTAPPAQMPTLTSLVKHWNHFSPEAKFNTYGFDIQCLDSCDASTYTITVGQAAREETRRTDDPTDVSGYFLEGYRDERSDMMAFSGTGLLEHVRTKTTEVPAGSPSPTPAPMGPVESSPVRSDWVVPSVPAAAGAGALALVAGAAYAFWPMLKSGMLAPLFSRIQDDKVLEHPTRRRIYDQIQESPGIHFQELGRRGGGANGSLHHHVRKLVATGLVTAADGGGYTCYFAKGQVDRDAMVAAPVLKADAARRVLDAVRRQPGLSSGAAAAQVRLSPSTMSYHVRRLEGAGLIEVHREGRKACLRPTELAVSVA